MRTSILLTITLVGLAATCYLGWAWQRIDGGAMFRDAGAPRAWPHPDRLILALNDWFEVRYPGRPGGIKLHGEFPRVLRTLMWGTAGAAAVTTAGVAGLALRWRGRATNLSRRGFEVAAAR